MNLFEVGISHISSRRQRNRRILKRAGAYLAIFMVSSFLLLYVWQRVQVIAVGYKVEELKKTRDSLARVNKNLRIEAATLTSPERVETLAGAYIGMRPPEDTQLVLVKRLAKARPAPGPRSAQAAPKADAGRS